MARPRSLIRKSWTRTSSGSPCGRHSRPPFLKSPTSSFFFVSTEIAGWPSARAVLTLVDVGKLRIPVGMIVTLSGLAIALQAELLLLQQFADDRVTDPMPELSSSAASWRRLLQVQRSGDIGSPRCRLDQRADPPQADVRSDTDLRPPPGRRTPPGGSGDGRQLPKSATDRARGDAVTRDTAAMPPCPAALASVAAKSRRCRSSSRGNIAALRFWSFRRESSSIISKATTPHNPREFPPPHSRARTD